MGGRPKVVSNYWKCIIIIVTLELLLRTRRGGRGRGGYTGGYTGGGALSHFTKNIYGAHFQQKPYSVYVLP